MTRGTPGGHFWRRSSRCRSGDPEIELFRRCTSRQRPPGTNAREGWAVVGRRGGKSRVAALLALYLACFRDWAPHLSAGEVGTVMLLGADRRQARVAMRYVLGLIEGVPMLRRMVVKRTAESLELTNRIVVEIHTASFRSVRGYSVVAAIADEIAFWRSEDSANPDSEIIAGLRPAMATLPGALLLAISSPYARRGALFEAHKQKLREGQRRGSGVDGTDAGDEPFGRRTRDRRCLLSARSRRTGRVQC
jgi:hypothetical protein